MEIPSPQAGIVKAVNVKIGDLISQGDPILTLEIEGDSVSASAADSADKRRKRTRLHPPRPLPPRNS
jgi:pyruvate/2-oxoglutarate dehydrogenase complex dihydrolipoamide acyltransferase (E2) component